MRTKIIATLGPASQEKEIIKKLVKAGVSVFRLNFSHGTAKDFTEIVRRVREVEEETGIAVTLMQDLCGPKFRVGELEETQLEISRGQEVFFGDPRSGKGTPIAFIPFDQTRVLKGLDPGDQVFISDGSLQFEVLGKEGPGLLHMRAQTDGFITSRKGVSFPGKTVPVSALTDKDKKDIKAGLKLGIDAVALSFVQSAEDVGKAKQIIAKAGTWVPVIAKLERKSALDNFDEILKQADGVMVARGDLGLDMPLPSLPALQKRIIEKCNKVGKPVIVATQMLLSMVGSPMPTRAETTDVANAVLDGADCVMLSDETAIGKYPVQTVGFMREIAVQAESLMQERHWGNPLDPAHQEDPAWFLAYAACLLAKKANAKALVAHTASGGTARLLSACRPWQPIYALSPDQKVKRYMNFTWGVIPVIVEEKIANHLERAQKFIEDNPEFKSGDTLVITAGQTKPGQTQSPTNVVKIYTK